MVEFDCGGARRTCELGDTFVVYRERISRSQVRSQALALQAKTWSGANRSQVEATPEQWALYQHWPRFSMGLIRPVSLPPGDYGRMLGIGSAVQRAETPLVSHRVPTAPGCQIPSGKPKVAVSRSLGWVVGDMLRFGTGERVDGQWARVSTQVIRHVGTALVGPTFWPPGPRGLWASARENLGAVEGADMMARILAGGDAFDALLSSLIGHAGDVPPTQTESHTTGEENFALVVIDADASPDTR